MDNGTEANQAAEGEDTSLEVTEAEATEAGEAGEFEESGEAEEETEEELEEIERGGKTYRIPKALKPELLMQADYTRKTMALSEAQKAFEAERQSVSQADEEEMSAQTHLRIVESRIAELSKKDWDKWFDEAPLDATKAHMDLTRLQNIRGNIQARIGELKAARTTRETQATAKLMQEGYEQLQKDIPEWNDDLGGKVMEFAEQEYGFASDELARLHDPRIVKLLYSAFKGRQSATKNRVVENHNKLSAVKPAAKAGGAGAVPPGALSDKLSAEEWTRRRNEQLRRRG